MSINQNELAEEIAKREGLKESVNIAEIKEILRITLEILCEKFKENPDEVINLIT